jgi:hypothetical protein
MKLTEIDTVNYIELNEAIRVHANLWSKINKIITDLKEHTEYDFTLYVLNEFFEQEKYNLDKVSILVETDDIEQILENKLIDQYDYEAINWYLKIGNNYHIYKDGFWKKQPLEIKKSGMI